MCSSAAWALPVHISWKASGRPPSPFMEATEVTTITSRENSSPDQAYEAIKH